MKIYSYVQEQYQLEPIEIEVTCVTGTPEFEIIGQADSIIKECKHKIFSAFRSCGYEIPQNKKIFVNLRPNYLKKRSFGLDFAIAMAILWELKQVPKPEEDKLLLYGELGLEGDVFCPNDVAAVVRLPDEIDYLISGSGGEGDLNVPCLHIQSIRNFSGGSFLDHSEKAVKQVERKADPFYVSKDLAELMQAVAIGEHSVLFAGPKGTGKSTVVENLIGFLKPLSKEEFLFTKNINRFFGQDICSRPFVAPHHTTTTLAMVGGGAKAVPGEFTRAHGGVLLLDEYLEFSGGVQEALREPLETGKINVSRVGGRKEHPAKFLLMATTNLCPCGEYFPGQKNRCVCRLSLRKRYLERLSGPVLDRFNLLCFSEDWMGEEEVFLPDLQRQIQNWLQENPQKQKHSSLSIDALEKYCSKDVDRKLLKRVKRSSRRRLKATLQLAYSFSVMKGSNTIDSRSLQKALKFTYRNFEDLRWTLSRD